MTPLRKGGWLCEECDAKIGVTPPTLLDVPASLFIDAKTAADADVHVAPSTTCPSCETRNPGAFTFCLECGHDLRKATTTQQLPAQQTPEARDPVSVDAARNRGDVGNDAATTGAQQRAPKHEARCPACAHAVGVAARFCEQCGARLGPA